MAGGVAERRSPQFLAHHCEEQRDEQVGHTDDGQQFGGEELLDARGECVLHARELVRAAAQQCTRAATHFIFMSRLLCMYVCMYVCVYVCMYDIDINRFMKERYIIYNTWY